MTEYIIILIIGLIMIMIASGSLRKQSKIKKKGLKTEGIVYELLNGLSSSFNVKYPVIRFLTLKQEWITETFNTGMFPGFYKKGEKVTVIYDQEDPKQFIIDSKINNFIVYTILTAGFLLTFFGAYKLA